MRVKYSDIVAATGMIYQLFGNKVNSLETIEYSIVETIKDEKVSLDDALKIILPEIVARSDSGNRMYA